MRLFYLVIIAASLLLFSCVAPGTVLGKRVVALPDLMTKDTSYEYTVTTASDAGESVTEKNNKIATPAEIITYAATLMYKNNFKGITAMALKNEFESGYQKSITYRIPGLDNKIYADTIHNVTNLMSIINLRREDNPDKGIMFVSINHQLSLITFVGHKIFQYYEVWALKKGNSNQLMAWKTVCRETADKHDALAQACIQTAKNQFKNSSTEVKFETLPIGL